MSTLRIKHALIGFDGLEDFSKYIFKLIRNKG